MHVEQATFLASLGDRVSFYVLTLFQQNFSFLFAVRVFNQPPERFKRFQFPKLGLK
jgi:hypothetical protein